MAQAWQQEELATRKTMMHSRTVEQSVEEGLANPLCFFANLLTVYVIWHKALKYINEFHIHISFFNRIGGHPFLVALS